jgi:2-polyprenyl-3-methyl-5-hydroxy-6-metoxy-1,4-benzoquinol methylase
MSELHLYEDTPFEAARDADRPHAQPAIGLPTETIYGHRGRLEWIRGHLRAGDRVLELGCGTGNLITMPLLGWGHDVVGVDLDEVSIAYGKKMLSEAGLDPSALVACDVRELSGEFDVVVASEVLEHLADEDLHIVLAAVRERLAPGGRLVVTVPNGYGLFELENFLWYRTGLHRLFTRLRNRALGRSLRRLKRKVATGWREPEHPMTLADSPHRQRFTWRSIQKVLAKAGFEVVHARGGVQACGPFTDLLFSGHARVMALNGRLGRLFPRSAAGFYLVGQKR